MPPPEPPCTCRTPPPRPPTCRSASRPASCPRLLALLVLLLMCGSPFLTVTASTPATGGRNHRGPYHNHYHQGEEESFSPSTFPYNPTGNISPYTTLRTAAQDMAHKTSQQEPRPLAHHHQNHHIPTALPTALRRLQQLLLADSGRRSGGSGASSRTRSPYDVVPSMYDTQYMTDQPNGAVGRFTGPGVTALAARNPSYSGMLASEGASLQPGGASGRDSGGDSGGGGWGGSARQRQGQGRQGQRGGQQGGTGGGGTGGGGSGAAAGGAAALPQLRGKPSPQQQGQQGRPGQQQQGQQVAGEDPLLRLIMSNSLTASVMNPSTLTSMQQANAAAPPQPSIAAQQQQRQQPQQRQQQPLQQQLRGSSPLSSGQRANGNNSPTQRSGGLGMLGSQVGGWGAPWLQELQQGWTHGWQQPTSSKVGSSSVREGEPDGDSAQGAGQVSLSGGQSDVSGGGTQQHAGRGDASGSSSPSSVSLDGFSAGVVNDGGSASGGGGGGLPGIRPVSSVAPSSPPVASASEKLDERMIKGVGLKLDPGALGGLSSEDVLWGLYRLYNTGTGGVGADRTTAVGDGSVGGGVGVGQSEQPYKAVSSEMYDSVKDGQQVEQGSMVGAPGSGPQDVQGVRIYRTQGVADGWNSANGGDEYDSDVYGSTALDFVAPSSQQDFSRGRSSVLDGVRRPGAGGYATVGPGTSKGSGNGARGGGGYSRSQRASGNISNGSGSNGGDGNGSGGNGGGGNGGGGNGGGGNGSGSNGGGGNGGGGNGGGGNGTRTQRFPFCQPPYLLCADRDLVTFLGVTTDQVIFTPTVQQYMGVGAAGQRSLVAANEPNFFDRTQQASLLGALGLRFSNNLLFNGLNGALGTELGIARANVDRGPRGRILPDSVTLTALGNTGRSTIDRVNYKPNWVLTGTGPGFATTAVNFGPYGNFRIPGGLNLANTFSINLPP